jgi:hypothetical protein
MLVVNKWFNRLNGQLQSVPVEADAERTSLTAGRWNNSENRDVSSLTNELK